MITCAQCMCVCTCMHAHTCEVTCFPIFVEFVAMVTGANETSRCVGAVVGASMAGIPTLVVI